MSPWLSATAHQTHPGYILYPPVSMTRVVLLATRWQRKASIVMLAASASFSLAVPLRFNCFTRWPSHHTHAREPPTHPHLCIAPPTHHPFLPSTPSMVAPLRSSGTRSTALLNLHILSAPTVSDFIWKRFPWPTPTLSPSSQPSYTVEHAWVAGAFIRTKYLGNRLS
jgi:hypothetical protein